MTSDPEPPRNEITQLLQRWGSGDADALEKLLPLVYQELRSMARRYLGGERGSPTMQRTALVHEAFLRLVNLREIDWQCRSQFFAIAARTMRRILVDQARARASLKRDGGERVDLDQMLAQEEIGEAVAESAVHDAEVRVDFLEVHEALTRLEALDPAQGTLVELRFFGGLSIEETAEVTGVSPATVKREWAMARAWLQRELSGRTP